MAMMVAMASRKRDDRGRYAEGDEMRRMNGDMEMRHRRDDGGGESRYWPEPHIPPYLNRPENRMTRMEHEPSRMRDRNVVNIRDYQDRRQIGFAPRMDDDDDEEEREMRQYGRRYDPERPTMHHGAMRETYHDHGTAEGADDERLSRDEAERWVRGMQSEDRKKGGRWTLKEIQQYAGNYGIRDEDVVEFFAVLNALYTDYGKVARKFGFDRMEVWAELAKAFMHDKDAMPGKVKMYYECIAKKDE